MFMVVWFPLCLCVLCCVSMLFMVGVIVLYVLQLLASAWESLLWNDTGFKNLVLCCFWLLLTESFRGVTQGVHVFVLCYLCYLCCLFVVLVVVLCCFCFTLPSTALYSPLLPSTVLYCPLLQSTFRICTIMEHTRFVVISNLPRLSSRTDEL